MNETNLNVFAHVIKLKNKNNMSKRNSINQLSELKKKKSKLRVSLNPLRESHLKSHKLALSQIP